MNSFNRQSGSAIIYVIVGVLLTAAVVGGIMMAHLRGRSAPGGAPQITVNDKNKGQDKSDSGSSDKNKGQTSQQSNSNQQNSEQQIADKKAADEKAAAEKKAADEKRNAAAEAELKQRKQAAESRDSQPAGSASPSQDGPMARATTGSHMPTTGPAEDFLGSMIGVFAIVAAGYVYYHSGRRIV